MAGESVGDIEIEARPYGPDSTPEEREALLRRVWLYRPDIVYWHELPVMSEWQVELFGRRMEELTESVDDYGVLVDLRHAKPPNAAIRRRLRDVYTRAMKSGLSRAAVFTEANFFINVAAKFVMGGAGLRVFSVHKHREDAEAALGIR